MIVTLGIIAVLLTVLVTRYFLRPRSKYRLPPGPPGLPFLGNMSWLLSRAHLHLSLTKIGEKYGDIFSLNFLGQNVVVLNSAEVIREVFVTEECAAGTSGRPCGFLGKYTDDDCSSLSFMSTGKMWQRLRKIFINAINVRSMEDSVIRELGYSVRWLEDRSGTDVDLNDLIISSMANITTHMLLGCRHDYDSFELKAALDMTHSVNYLAMPGINGVLSLLPTLRLLPFGYGALYKKYMSEIQEFLKHYYHTPKQTFTLTETRGLTDVLLRTQQEFRFTGDNSAIEDCHVTSTIKDAMEGGLLAMVSSISSFVLLIQHRPDVARKIQQEIDKQIGPNRYPSSTDRCQMPYTEATITEILRFVTPSPLPIPRCTMEDVSYRKYHIPAGTVVYTNLWSVNHDSDHWENPFEFHPERFLDDCGMCLPADHPNRTGSQPFNLGKRACPAEQFSRLSLFMYMTTFLQRFNFLPADDTVLPPFDPRTYTDGLIPCPRPFKVRVKLRSE